MKKILIVGAGFTGAVIARQLAEAGYVVDIIEKRDHIAGNAYDYQYANDDGNIRVHKYGPHLFHTNNVRVFEYLSKYTNWVSYKHKVKALLEDGQFVTLPVNKETKDIVGEENVLDIFFRPYSRKMWGMELEELNPEIINRVPIRDDMNEFYFPDDKYQCLPDNGYTSLVHNIISHQNIRLSLNAEFDKSMEDSYHHVFNSMPIDEYYNSSHGELPYRSIKFDTKCFFKTKIAMPTPTVNFTDDEKFTRVTEWSQLPNHGENSFYTVCTYEEPCDYKDNNLERYYPVKDVSGNNRKIYNKYKAIINDKVTFVGRCGTYSYLDMHQAVNMALQVSEKFINENMSPRR